MSFVQCLSQEMGVFCLRNVSLSTQMTWALRLYYEGFINLLIGLLRYVTSLRLMCLMHTTITIALLLVNLMSAAHRRLNIGSQLCVCRFIVDPVLVHLVVLFAFIKQVPPSLHYDDICACMLCQASVWCLDNFSSSQTLILLLVHEQLIMFHEFLIFN